MSSPVPRQRIGKLDAAQRQLRTAVKMFFDDGDDVSIRTLVAAARQILLDLLKRRGRSSRFQEGLQDLLTPEGLAVFRQAIAEPENFFKHANRDPDRELEFNPESTSFMLIECGVLHQEITGRNLRDCWVFFLWVGFNDPRILRPGPLLERVKQLRSQGLGPQPGDKRMFLETINTLGLWPDLD